MDEDSESTTARVRTARNGGGWLKSGNTRNVGRKTAKVRAEILSTVSEFVGCRPATIAEVVLVWKESAAHALPYMTEVTGEETKAFSLSDALDLSRMTAEEKEQLLSLLEKGKVPAP